MVESGAVFVPLTVILEFEWVMRGFCERLPGFDDRRFIRRARRLGLAPEPALPDRS